MTPPEVRNYEAVDSAQLCADETNECIDETRSQLGALWEQVGGLVTEVQNEINQMTPAEELEVFMEMNPAMKASFLAGLDKDGSMQSLLNSWREVDQTAFNQLFLSQNGDNFNLNVYGSTDLESILNPALLLPDEAEYIVADGQLLYRGYDVNGKETYVQTGHYFGLQSVKAGLKDRLGAVSLEKDKGSQYVFTADTNFEILDSSTIQGAKLEAVRSSEAHVEAMLDENDTRLTSAEENFLLTQDEIYRQRLYAVTSNVGRAQEEPELLWTPELQNSLANSENEEVRAVFAEIEHRHQNTSRLSSELNTQFPPDETGTPDPYVDKAIAAFEKINLIGVNFIEVDDEGYIIASLGVENDVAVKIDPKTQTMVPADFQFNAALSFPVEEASLMAVQILSSAAQQTATPREEYFAQEIRRANKDRFVKFTAQAFPFRSNPLDETTLQGFGRAVDALGIQGFAREVEGKAEAGGRLMAGRNMLDEQGWLLPQNAAYFRQEIEAVIKDHV